MAKKAYVGNLSYDVSEDALRDLFTPFGTVESVNIITDRDTGRSKGFGFVEMSSEEELKAAIAGLDSKEHEGRTLRVNEAKPRNTGGGQRGGFNRNRYSNEVVPRRVKSKR